MGNLDGLGYRGTNVVVTGGSSGMGEAVAQILTGLGAAVHIVDIQAPKIPCAGFYKTDLAAPDEVSATAEKLRAVGPFDFLFPCAGVPPHAVAALKCMLINYVGARQFIEEMLPAVKDGGGIALISSDACLSWQKNLAQNLELLAIADPRAARAWCEEHPDKLRDGYTTSKEMLAVWVQKFSIELGMTRRIRLNATAPCPTKTAFVDASVDVLGQDFLDNFPYPVLHRMATAQEQAWPLILLNSPLNAVVTGALLYTDQGFVSGLFTGAIDSAAMTGSARKA
jgi:NAD(P)-dependent dehydrogenase (short-subunit alcohol dehydrogenase family)